MTRRRPSRPPLRSTTQMTTSIVHCRGWGLVLQCGPRILPGVSVRRRLRLCRLFSQRTVPRPAGSRIRGTEGFVVALGRLSDVWEEDAPVSSSGVHARHACAAARPWSCLVSAWSHQLVILMVRCTARLPRYGRRKRPPRSVAGAPQGPRKAPVRLSAV